MIETGDIKNGVGMMALITPEKFCHLSGILSNFAYGCRRKHTVNNSFNILFFSPLCSWICFPAFNMNVGIVFFKLSCIQRAKTVCIEPIPIFRFIGISRINEIVIYIDDSCYFHSTILWLFEVSQKYSSDPKQIRKESGFHLSDKFWKPGTKIFVTVWSHTHDILKIFDRNLKFLGQIFYI